MKSVDNKAELCESTWFHEYTPETIEKVLLQAGFSKVQVSEKLYGVEQGKEWLTVIAEK